MSQAVVVFPHQLFWPHPLISKQTLVVLVEDRLFFQDEQTNITMHAKKLILHRASMKAYEKQKLSQYQLVYVEWQQAQASEVLSALKEKGIGKIESLDPVDDWLRHRWQQASIELGIDFYWVDASPGFLMTKKEVVEDLESRNRLFQTDFYRNRRKKMNVLMHGNKPVGGKWTFDVENRKTYPKNMVEPGRVSFGQNRFVTEAVEYVQRTFEGYKGNLDSFSYAVTHAEASEVLDEFSDHMIDDFGRYQDAINPNMRIGFHAHMSMYLNIGLLTPSQVLEQVIEAADQRKIPLASLEGFVRQIVGWREFIRGVYELKGREQRLGNFFGFTRKLSKRWYEGTTNMIPVDTVIKSLDQTGYAHHIERLMLLGNLMLLCEIDPDEVYIWFMEMFVDSYDWVMVPNVYGMSQYADGGMMVTKPYISSSNYIRKMSNYTKDDWSKIWDSLYWRFIWKQKDSFENNPRMGMMVRLVQKMDRNDLNQHIRQADAFLSSLD